MDARERPPPLLLREPSPSPVPRARRAPTPTNITSNSVVSAAPADPVIALLESLSSKVESSLSGVLNRIEALERRHMPPPPPPPARREPPPRPPATVPTVQTPPPTEPPPDLPLTPTSNEEGFTQVNRRRRANRSYASAATNPAPLALTNPNQTSMPTPLGRANPLSAAPTLSEVTVVRHGGKLISAEEQALRSRAPDGIARTVIEAIRAASPKHPAIPRSGRWGHHSKGNFIYTFNGLVTPQQVRQVEQLLLEPFPDGELIINHGWSRVMLKRVPVFDISGRPACPVSLEMEVRCAIPALTKKPFA